MANYGSDISGHVTELKHGRALKKGERINPRYRKSRRNGSISGRNKTAASIGKAIGDPYCGCGLFASG
jgi:hypothetical protein